METMLSFADSSSSQDEADDEEDSEEEDEDWVKDVEPEFEELANGKHRSLSLVRTEFSSQPDLPTFIQVSIRSFIQLLKKTLSLNVLHVRPRSLLVAFLEIPP